jgi:hypothetical protein
MLIYKGFSSNLIRVEHGILQVPDYDFIFSVKFILSLIESINKSFWWPAQKSTALATTWERGLII